MCGLNGGALGVVVVDGEGIVGEKVVVVEGDGFDVGGFVLENDEVTPIGFEGGIAGEEVSVVSENLYDVGIFCAFEEGIGAKSVVG
mgnify:CR=1 FL=1